MSGCRKITTLYEEFKRNPIGTSEAEDPINNFFLKKVGDKVKDWAIAKGVEKAVGTFATKQVALKAARFVGSAWVSIPMELLSPSDSMKSGVDRYYDVLKAIILDLGQSRPDYGSAHKRIPFLRDALDTIKIEERASFKEGSNCFASLEGIIQDIEKLCSTRGQQIVQG